MSNSEKNWTVFSSDRHKDKQEQHGAPKLLLIAAQNIDKESKRENTKWYCSFSVVVTITLGHWSLAALCDVTLQWAVLGADQLLLWGDAMTHQPSQQGDPCPTDLWLKKNGSSQWHASKKEKKCNDIYFNIFNPDCTNQTNPRGFAMFPRCFFFSIKPIFHCFVSQFVLHDFISMFFLSRFLICYFLKMPINWGPGGPNFNRQNNLFSLCLPWVLI